jgi:hypothetical protein
LPSTMMLWARGPGKGWRFGSNAAIAKSLAGTPGMVEKHVRTVVHGALASVRPEP